MILAGVVLAASGCAEVKIKEPFPLRTIAVLPFDNETNDLNAPDIMQKLVAEVMKSSPYEIRDTEETNKWLEKVGIVDGGQLAIVDPVRLGRDMGVQALMFGYVENFNYTNVGYYVERKVSLSLRLVDVETGATLWENDKTAATRAINTDSKEATAAFVAGLASQALDKLFKVPLQLEARAAAVGALRSLPGLRFVSVSDPRSQQLDGFKNLLKKSLGK